MTQLVALVLLIALHAPGGRVILLNPASVASMRAEIEEPNALVHDKVRCVIATTDGKLVNVVETCDTVRELIRGGAQ